MLTGLPNAVHLAEEAFATLCPNLGLHRLAQAVHHSVGSFAARRAWASGLMAGSVLLRSHYFLEFNIT